MLKHLRLDRPLTFIDLETTGVDPRRDRIVEIALLQFAPGAEPRALEIRLNPQRPIPPVSTAVHGILDKHVANCPTFAKSAKQIAEFIDESDLAGFGVARFDLPCLVAEFERTNWVFPLRGRRIVDALTLFHRLEPRDLAAAVRRYCNTEHAHAHNAALDVKAAAAVLDAMLGENDGVPRAPADLHKYLIEVDVAGWFRRNGASLVFARGKHQDVQLDEVAVTDPSYLSWLLNNVLSDARWHIENALCQSPD